VRPLESRNAGALRPTLVRLDEELHGNGSAPATFVGLLKGRFAKTLPVHGGRATKKWRTSNEKGEGSFLSTFNI
jgi:hypothetical protein